MNGQRGLARRTTQLFHRLDANAPGEPSVQAPPANRRDPAYAQSDSLEPANHPTPLPPRLNEGIRRLLMDGRALLNQLGDIAGPLHAMANDDSPAASAYHRTLAMTETFLRTVPFLLNDAETPSPFVDGLEAFFGDIRERTSVLSTWTAQRWKELERIHTLADWLSGLINNRPVLWKPITDLAEAIWLEADACVPLRFQAGRSDDSSPELITATHCLNVAKVMARLTRRRPDYRNRPLDPIVASLVFDAGMAGISREVTDQAEPLDAELRKQVEAHVGLSAEAIKHLVPAEGWLYDVVMAHHERLDGSGYPAGLQGVQIPRLSRLLAVCDVYVSLSSSRPWRSAASSRSALTETLLQAEQGRLDAELAEYLLDLSFYPVGTAVELADGCVGIVVHPGFGDKGDVTIPSRPVVQLLVDGKGLLLAWPETINLAQSEGRSIIRSLTTQESRAHLGERFWHLL